MDFLKYNIFELKQTPVTDMYNTGKGRIKIKKEVEQKIVIKDKIVDIDNILDDYVSNKGYVYLFQLITKYNRYLYVGSTKNPKKRECEHIKNLKRNRHHNKTLQSKYNVHMNENIDFKFTVIESTSDLKNLVNKEHDTLIDISSRYHNKLDNKNRIITVVYSQ